MTHPHIPTKPVKSSSIKAVGYDPASKVLRVKFHSEDVYDYAGVTEKEHEAMMNAESIGRHFMKAILPRHKHTKIE